VGPREEFKKPAKRDIFSDMKEKKTIDTPAPKEYSFFQDVYDVVRQIPKGRITSYGAIASYLGTKLSARMVGWAMNAAGLVKPKVPAHRVVNRNGMLSGKHHFSTPTQMEELLKKEKVEVKNDKVIDFEELFWNPADELSL
jgi:methylated-DNA-protein-cysteine methyltransferase related protein